MLVCSGSPTRRSRQVPIVRVAGVHPDMVESSLRCLPRPQYPSYYTVSFHAYTEGNMGWEPALEVEAAAKSVHANVFSATGKELDPEGDARLRGSYSTCMTQLLGEMGARPVHDIVDIGCATGLSTLELARVFPGARLTGVDLSAYFLAVGQFLQEKRLEAGQGPEVRFLHAAGEKTGLPALSQDLVSMCLVAHELPQHATRAIAKEAHRLVRPGGAFAIMEMNPGSPIFQRITSNVFAYTAFKSTEVRIALCVCRLDGGFDANQYLPFLHSPISMST